MQLCWLHQRSRVERARGALAAAKAAAAQFVPALIVERIDGSEAAAPAAGGGVSSIRAHGITEGPPQVSEGGSLWHTVPGRRAGGCPARHRKIVCGLGARRSDSTNTQSFGIVGTIED